PSDEAFAVARSPLNDDREPGVGASVFRYAAIAFRSASLRYCVLWKMASFIAPPTTACDALRALRKVATMSAVDQAPSPSARLPRRFTATRPSMIGPPAR